MSEVTEQIASVLDRIPIELQNMPNDLIGLLIRAKAEIDELEEQLTYAIESIEGSGVDYDEVRTAYLLEGVIE
jgi:phage terminase Nu1 subunit (DNA packaging protein)